ncbi:hypothetical protein GCM10027277_03180 [Pseudoduganella ginsengisoli]|nr:helix-hairpin-helix domain-containing protein [Pseudoduganella ginsengisoli]
MQFPQHLLFACALGAASAANAAELGVLSPVIINQEAQMQARPTGPGSAPVLARVSSGALFDAIQKEATSGFTASAIALDALASEVAGVKNSGITWLMLSQEDGGFPRWGFWLQEGEQRRYIDEPMVDLVVDADSVADGSFEEIFAHELGHVMLRRLLPLPEGYSRTPHHSYSMTDQPTALDEGFATHFQALARQHTKNAQLRAQDMGVGARTYVALWQSNLDRAYRIDGVRQNWFVHRQVTLPGDGGAADAIERRELSTLFDREHLKSAPQMLASEGVVATFFYRWLGAGEGTAAALRSRYLPLFNGLKAMRASALTPETPLLPALAAVLARTEPEAGRHFAQVLVESSYGALTSPALAAQSEAVAQIGRTGNSKTFVPALKAARRALAAEVAEVQAHPEKLAVQAGPALWVKHPTRTLAAWGEPVPLVVDLNTAELEHLSALPGIDAATAKKALASRQRDGNFTSLADFAARAGLNPAQLKTLKSMAADARAAGTYARS